jgi:hypothetical protein
MRGDGVTAYQAGRLDRRPVGGGAAPAAGRGGCHPAGYRREAFLLRQLAVDDRPVDEQAAIVGRARDRDAASVLGSVIRTVQDLAGDREDHPALADLMGNMARDYLGRCEMLGRTPDMALLDPIVAIFQQLQTPQENPV